MVVDPPGFVGLTTIIRRILGEIKRLAVEPLTVARWSLVTRLAQASRGE